MRYLSEVATFIACMGGFLFGYDIGVISGVLVMPTFATTFGINAAQAADLKGNVVSFLQIGCCFGALLINFVADHYGRKVAIFGSSIVSIFGGILQTVSVGKLSVLIIGRFFAGVGIGANSMLVPMYIAEIAPRKLRGRLGTLWQFLIVLGICVSYWVDYLCLKVLPPSDLQWQLALGLQIVPGVVLAIGIIFMPESLRWLAAHDRHEEARCTLSKLRGLYESDHSVTAEMEAIQDAIDCERETSTGKLTEIFQVVNFKRLWTGSNAINYYAPVIFQSIGITSAEIDVLATGVYGTVKVAFVFASFFMIDTKLGRRRTLMIGSAFMCTAFYILGTMTKLNSDNNGGSVGGSVGSLGYVAIFSVYLFAIGYEFSWGPIVWIVCSEIYPTRIRAICLSITTAFNWGNNAIIGKVTPIMLVNIGWGTYFLFGSFAVVMGLFVFFFLPETRGRSLEEMEEIFQGGIFVHNKIYTEPKKDYFEEYKE
ncbi:general substrate transporter [Jimgerdemannia flammicorona]|uniref:General substrate transporter n=1 Tax=Jimgerdemannia flammicorona TaxID=994334 RepID=A0A433QNZ6_9FUNG|nr:general substrate transporter [Jimgerdemannia flammicorona]